MLSCLWLFSPPSKADPPILEHTIVDDGWVQIDLGFTFPLYDKTWTTSFMFANGVVGFISPTEIPGTGIQNDGLCCNAYDFDNVDYANMGATYGGNYAGVRFDYLVAPWHTDLIDIGAGVFKTQGDATFQSYFWENISEYYDANDINTFSTTLYPLGNINFTYQKLDIQEHKVSVFVSGDLSAGDYEQFFYNDPTNGGVYWTSGDSTPVEIDAEESICDVVPDASIVCLWYPENYAAAYFDQQCAISGLYNSGCTNWETANCAVDGLWSPTCSNYETAYFDNQCVLDPLYSPACTGWYYVEEEETENEEYGVPEEEYEEYEVFEPETTYSESTGFDISLDFDTTDTFAPTFETDYQEYDVSFDDIMIEFEQEIQQEMETLFAEMDIEMEMPEMEMPEFDDFPEMEEMTEPEFEDFEMPEPEMEEPIEEVLDEPIEENIEETVEEPETETEPIEEETNEEEVLNEESVESEEEATEEDEGTEDEEIDEAVEEEEEVDEEPSESEESEESTDEESEEESTEEEVDESEPEEKEVMVAKVEPKKMTADEKKKARQKKMREIITDKLKNLAVEMGEASSLEAQKQLQNIILALLNYNQGFSSYNLSLADGNFYESRVIYPIRLPDSLRGRRIGLASELLHKQLVDIQWSEDYGRKTN